MIRIDRNNDNDRDDQRFLYGIRIETHDHDSMWGMFWDHIPYMYLKDGDEPVYWEEYYREKNEIKYILKKLYGVKFVEKKIKNYYENKKYHNLYGDKRYDLDNDYLYFDDNKREKYFILKFWEYEVDKGEYDGIGIYYNYEDNVVVIGIEMEFDTDDWVIFRESELKEKYGDKMVLVKRFVEEYELGREDDIKFMIHVKRGWGH